MSMYKTIFVTEETDLQSGEQVFTINGEVSLYGESAFSSLDEAVSKIAGVDANAVVVKVASGKYDSYVVINNGVAGSETAVSEVVAVDFNGTAMPTADGEVVINETGLAADAQGAVIGYLNNTGLSEGKLFVSAADAPAGSNTLYVGAADTVGYVAGSNGNTLLNINGEFMNSLSDSATTLATESEIYVSADYNASTEGWGTTRFATYSSAYNYAIANAKNSTIIIEDGVGDIVNEHKNYKNLNVTVTDGATARYGGNKLDVTYDLFLKAGSTMLTTRPSGKPSYSHIKEGGTLVVGEAGAAEKAVLNFGATSSYDTIDVQVRYDGKMTAVNADITVGDFDAQGAFSMSDSTMKVEGAFATTASAFYKTVITNSEITVAGIPLAGGISDSSGGSYNQIGNVELTKSSITFGTGSTVIIPKAGFLTKAPSITDSSIIADTMQINANVTAKGNSVLKANTMAIAGTLTIDSSALIEASSLNLTGKIVVNILDGFQSGSKIIDLTGSNAQEALLKNVEFVTSNGDIYEAAIQDGDIVAIKAFVPENGELDLSNSSAATDQALIAANKITTGTASDVREESEISAKVIGQDIELENSKNLAVTGSIEATGTATLTNKGENIVDEQGNLVAEAVLNGGYDAEGNEKAAKIEAEKIVLQNDGHANVELAATTINIANNSNETLTGIIGNADTESVVIAAGTATADGVTIDGTLDGTIENATITGENISIADQEVSNSTLNGTTAIAADSSLDNTKVNGVVSVGFDAENAADTTLTLKGETSIGTLYVGKEGRENEYNAVITGKDTDVSLGQLYNRLGSTLEITDGAHLEVNNYWQSKGDVVIDGASAELTGVNMYVYNNDTTDAATITLRNGASLSTKANYAIYLGNSESGPAKGNASMTLESGSSLNVKNLTLHADGEVEEVAGAAASTSVSVTDSTLNVSGLLTNNGTVTIGGESELNIAAAAGKAVDFADGAVITSTTGANFSEATHSIGGMTFGSGKFNFAGSAMAYDKLTLNAGADVTAAQTFAVYDDATIADGASVFANSVYVNGGNLTLEGDLTAKGNDGGLLLRNSDKSFNVDGGNVDVAYIEGTRGTVAVNLTNATVKGGHHITDNGGTLNWNIDNSSVSARTWTGAGDIKVNNGGITVTETLTNNGTFTVAGESTLNIAAVAAGSNDIELSEGTILKDSTIMGDVGITGNVTFRGKNVLNNLYDFGEYGAYGNTDWAKWTVEAGSQLFLEQSVTGLGNNLYGVGYGDTVVINGNLTDADAARAAGLTKDDASFYSRTGVRFSSGAGWATSSFTVNNAYVILGTDGSFSNSASNGGSHEITFNNAVVDAAQFYFSESSATFDMSITDSNINAVIFMTADTDSVYTLTGSKVVTTGSGNDRYNGNAGALTITDSEITVQTGSYKNSGTITFTDSTLTAASVANTGTINLTVTAEKLATVGNDAYYIINQTGDGAALNNTVTIDGVEHSIGQSFTKDGVEYSITNGTGNDIVIQAAAKILTVNSAYTEDTPGFGFSKFNKFEDALQAASSEATAIKLESDVTVASGIGYYNLPADLSIIAEEHVTLDMAGNSFSPMGKKTLVVGENVEITNMGQMIAYESQVILNGDFAGAHLWTFGWNGDAENGATGLTINETSKVTVATQLEFRGGDVTINGNITDTAAALDDADQIQLLGTTYGAWGGSTGYATKVNLNDTYIKLAQNTIGGAATKFQDGSSAIVTMDNSIYETAGEGVFNVASTGLVKAENGSIIYINSGVQASNAGTINITDSTFVSNSTFTSSGEFNVSGESTLNINKLITADSSSFVLADDATLKASTIGGDGKTLITAAGDLNIADDVTLNNINYLRTDRTHQGDLTIAEGKTLTVNGNVQYYNGDITGGGELVVSGGFVFGSPNSDLSTIATDVTVGYGYLYENVAIDGATFTLNANNGEVLYLGANSRESNVVVKNGGALVSEKPTVFINEGGDLAVDGGTIDANIQINHAESTFSATGDSTLKFDTLKGTSNTITLGGAEDRSTLEIGSKSGNGASIDASRLNIYKADVTLTDDVSVGAPTNVLHKIQDSTIDMGENTLSYKGFTVLDSYSGKSYLGSNEGVTLKNGEFKVTDSAHLCFQGYDHVVAEDAVVTFDGTNINSSMVNVYGSLTINGKVNVTHGNFGYDNVGTTDTGWGKASYPESVLTVSGEKAAYTIENGHMFRVYHETDKTGAGTMTVENGASFSFTGSRNGTGLFYNSNIVNVDAASSFTVDSYYGHAENNAAKMGSFNSTTAGEMIVLGNVTVNKTLTTDSLVINQGAALSAGNLKVNNLTLEIGGSLTLTGTGSEVGTFTVTGALNPENAEFTLVTSGWKSSFAGSIHFDNVEYVWDETAGKYLNGDTLDSEEFYFTVQDGALYVGKADAATTGVYIGDVTNAVDNKITVDGVTYTVGEDAFANADDAAAAAENDPALKDNVTQLAIDADYASDADKLSTLKESFVNLKEITVSENGKLEDTSTTAVAFADGLTLNNEGHFIANVEVSGDFIFTNASPNTLGSNYMVDGNMSGTNFDNGAMFGDYNVTGNIDLINLGTLGDTANSTSLTAGGSIYITGGNTAAAIEVNTDMLYLTDTESFNVDAAHSSVITSGNGYIVLDGSANLSIDGDVDSEVIINSDLATHSGTLTLNGDQTYGEFAELSAKKIVIAAGNNVTINGLADSKELEIVGTLNTAFDDMSNFTSAGNVTGTGTLNTTHTGDWVVNDSVTRDFSGFTGMVSMGDASASIVLGKGDIVNGAAAKESYFSDNATVTVEDTQSVVLAGDGVNTGIDFKGTGVLNVGDYDDKDQSENFSQTLSGDNTGFTGTVNVEEGAVLKIESAINASKINLNAEAVQSAEDTSDELLDTQLVLNSNDLSLSAEITGDADDIIAVKENATLSGNNSTFKGIVDIAANKDLSLGGNLGAATVNFGVGSDLNVIENVTIDSKLVSSTGDNTAELDIADGKTATLSAAGALNSFTGEIELEGSTSKLVLSDANTTAATVKGAAGTVVDANGDLSLTTENALKDFGGTIELDNNTLTLGAANTTAAIITGSNKVDVNGDLSLTAAGALNDFEGTIELEGNKLTLGAANTTAAIITGTNKVDVNGDLSLTAAGALNGFTGTIELEDKTLTLGAANTTSATITGSNKVDVNGDLSLTAAGALNGFTGTIELEDKTLTLGAANTTSATVTGTNSIVANANQVFTGDVSNFSGTYNIGAANTVTLNGTFGTTVNAQGGTLTLGDKAATVTVNGGTGLNTLKFGNNTLTLGTGLFDNVNGTGSVVKFGDDKTFSSVTAGNIYVVDSDNLKIGSLASVVNLTIDASSDGTADVTLSETWDDTLNVTISQTDADAFSGIYELVNATGYTDGFAILLKVGSNSDTLAIGQSVKLGDYSWQLRNNGGTLELTKRAGYSNLVVVNSIWTAEPYAAVMDGIERIIGYDAAKNLDDAVAYIRGWDVGQGWEEVAGAGKIELTAGKYTLTDGKYLMTTGNDGNGVTKMTLAARDGEKASITGVLRGSDGSAATTLTVENVQLINNVFAGGKLVINNSNAAATTSSVLAAGVDKGSTNGSALEINGGTFSSRYVVGGSYNSTATTTVTVNGDTSVSIKNATIVGHIYGGSYVSKGTVEQTGDALVTIDASSAVSLRGNIYVSGYAASGAILNLNGDSIATFTGDAANLTFTGSVNATQSANDEIVVFDDFSGTFNGSLNGFDTITISGDTNLELGRRQTKTAETGLKFVVDNTTDTGDAAMYIVRDKNRWEFSNDIFVTTKYTESGSYVLIDNYAGDFSNFSFNLNGDDYTLGTIAGNGDDGSIVINVNDQGQLVLDYTAPTTITKAEIADGDEAIFTGKTLEADANSGNAMTFGGYNDAVSANVALNDTTVNGNIHTGWYGDLAFETTGTTVIDGSIDGYASLVDLTVSEGTTTITGAFDSGNGSDKVVINDNASLEVNVVSTGNNNDLIQLGEDAKMQVSGMIGSYTGDDRSLDTGNGDDTVVIGKNANVSVAGEIAFGNQNDTLVLETGASLTAGEINGGIDTDTFNMEKGSSVTCVSATMFEEYNLDVDAILSNSSTMYGVNVNVSGVAALSSDVAGATAVIGKVGSVGSLAIDDVDVVLDTATQIAGTATAADTTDDVWASLNKVGSSLVVAWGRNETELDAALEAFKADSTLTLGQAVVADAASLADNGVSAGDFDDKKNNGQLA